MSPGASLLDGWHVLELGSGLAVAVCGRMLADLGARVRSTAPPPPGALGAFLHGTLSGDRAGERHRGKERIAPEDRAEAIRTADIVVTDAPVTPEIEGTGATVVQVRPFGADGPDADRAATDLTLLCASGIARLLTGQVDDLAEPPACAPGEQSAFIAGIAAACAAVLAELGRRRGASRAVLDVSAQEALATIAIQELARASLHGRARSRRRDGDGNGSTVCILPAADGYVAISAREEHQWARWLEVMGRPVWGHDPRLAAKAGRAAHWDEVHASMSAWSRGRSKQDIADQAQAAHVPSFPLCAPHEHLGSEQLAHRGFFHRVWLGDATSVQAPGSPFGITLVAARPDPAPDAPAPAGAALPALPLAGLRVLDFSWVIAGPTATRYLAAMGADVIKVEAPGRGDPGRGSELHTVLGQGKRSVAIDLKSPTGADLARRLAARCDALIENFATGVMDRLGLGPADLHAIHPGLVYVSASGLGRTGPHASAVAYGTLLQCYSGFAGLCVGHGSGGLEERVPRVGMAWLDPMCGLMLALVTGAALAHRQATGGGARVDFSMVEAMLWTMVGPLLDAQTPAAAARLRACPCGVYPARGDDAWVGLAVTGDVEWRALQRVIGGELAALGALDAPARVAMAHRIDALVEAWTRTLAPGEIEAAARAAGIACARVASSLDLLASPHLHARGFWEETPADTLPGLPWRGRTPRSPAAAPALGVDTDAVLREVLGLDDDERARLRREGVIG